MSNHTLRYIVVEGSVSAHCCFEASVCDTTKPYQFDPNQFEAICECMSKEDAHDIAAAMNTKGQQP